MDQTNQKETLLDVCNLSVGFKTQKEQTVVVRDVSFSISNGETAALVGESGCGKSVTALSLARLLPSPAFYPSGSITFKGMNTLKMPRRKLCSLRGKSISYIFQDPASALNPVFRIGFQIGELLEGSRSERRANSLRLLDHVGLTSATECLNAYPHELSGGMQQRVGIAMAIAQRPDLLVADEPTTALDVTLQAQILSLLKKLQQEFGMAILLITHNLGLVAEIAHCVHVMYAGSLVESGTCNSVLSRPAHPYTRGLLDVVPRLQKTSGRLKGIPGSVPPPELLPPGCPFADRCPRADSHCRQIKPVAKTLCDHPLHQTSCFHPLTGTQAL